MNEDIIKISEVIDSHLGMNFVAEEFFNKINSLNFNKITIDFENVEFVSRSFTQEYLFQKLKTNKDIVEINVPVDVQKTFDAVSNDFK